MNSIHLRFATDQELTQWDAIVDKSVNGTIFHKRAFLAYHGDRFAGSERWMVAVKGNSVIAQLVYALSEEPDGKRVALSPYGASYGGFILVKAPGYNNVSDLVEALIEHLKQENIDVFRLTPPIACCSSSNLDVLSFAMLERGFRSVSREISSVVPLCDHRSAMDIISPRVRRNVRKAISNDVSVEKCAPLEDFWVPMDATFSKHGALPTHNRQQLADLMTRLPGKINLIVAYIHGEPVAGLGLFILNERVACTFYLCQSTSGEKVQALSLLVQTVMEECINEGFEYLDMGTSTVGMKPRENIFRFKEGFSAEGFFRETFEWS